MKQMEDCPLCDGTARLNLAITSTGVLGRWVKRGTRKDPYGLHKCIFCAGVGQVTSYARTAFLLWFPTSEKWLLTARIEDLIHSL